VSGTNLTKHKKEKQKKKKKTDKREKNKEKSRNRLKNFPRLNGQRVSEENGDHSKRWSQQKEGNDMRFKKKHVRGKKEGEKSSVPEVT